MTSTIIRSQSAKYPRAIRLVHWIRAVLVVGLIASGWYMTGLPETEMSASTFLYHHHKQFGVLVWLVAMAHLGLRWWYRSSIPPAASALKPWERYLSAVVHNLLIGLVLLVPMLGYSLSTSFTESDGVPFFLVSRLPELLPKNDAAFAVFRALHKYAAYLLLVCIVLHVAAAIKHRLFDTRGDTDVLPRMI